MIRSRALKSSAVVAPTLMSAASLRVLFVAPECAPWVKTGGLGDVAGALPPALRALGCDVRVLMPAYPQLADLAGASAVTARVAPFAGLPAARLRLGPETPVAPLYLLECDELFARAGGPYQDAAGTDWPDNWRRFGLLCHAAALLAGGADPGWTPQLVHCNDWPSGLVPAYLRLRSAGAVPSLMTVHNLSFQGLFDVSLGASLGLPAGALSIDGAEFYGSLSFLKAGLAYADALSTVSPTYAREIQTPEHGCGMEGLLVHRAGVLHGILNGIDLDVWDPARDPFLCAPYDVAHLERKALSKAALEREVGWEPRPDGFLLGMVSRLTEQKGVDLVLAALPGILEGGMRLVILGAGERALERALAQAASAHPDRVAVRLGFDEQFAHRVEAGIDAFLMPSRFEPCGLNQMYSQRYGTPPIACATGGLVDTIRDGGGDDAEASGFLFREPSADALAGALRRAQAVWGEPARWRRLQENGMQRDFGWAASARHYARLYAAIARPGR